MLRESDRSILHETCRLAAGARKPVKSLGRGIEPTWSVTVAQNGKALVSETFLPGDTEDAVHRLWKKIESRANPEELVLYITLEPQAAYQRIPPVTESIRNTGIKRVVVGTENPFYRERGKGIASLRNYGVDVILADGEEARACQLLYEDYAKAMNRFVPRLYLISELAARDIEFQLQPYQGDLPVKVDGILLDLNSLYQKNMKIPEGIWIVILDTYAGLASDHQILRTHGERCIVFVANTPDVEAKIPGLKKTGATIIPVPIKDARVDLAILLRKCRDLGLLSLYCYLREDLWQGLVQANLVDSVLGFVRRPYESARSLSLVASAKLLGGEKSQALNFRLEQPRLFEHRNQDFWVEAQAASLE